MKLEKGRAQKLVKLGRKRRKRGRPQKLVKLERKRRKRGRQYYLLPKKDLWAGYWLVEGSYLVYDHRFEFEDEGLDPFCSFD